VPKFAALLALSSSLLLACGSAKSQGPSILHDPCAPLAVVLPSDATDVERAAVTDALQMWNARGLTRLTLDDGPQVTDRVEVVFRKASGALYGLYDPSTGEVVLNSELADRQQLAVVAAHELGHAMGLVHVKPAVRTSVMNPSNTQVTPTSDDEQALSDFWQGCH
jgi:hypothetical protein